MSDLVQVKQDSLGMLETGLFPSVVSEAGEKASYKFLEFFTNTLSNKNTRRAYARAAYRFFFWCEARGLRLEQVDPVRTGLYFRGLEAELSAPSVKQELSAVKKLFDFFVVEGVTSFNPAASVKGPSHAPREGKTPELTLDETRKLFDSIKGDTLKDVRDKAVLGVLFYCWVRVGSLCNVNLEDYAYQAQDKSIRFRGKRGKVKRIPLHHKAVEYLEAYLIQADLYPELEDRAQKKAPLFRTLTRTKALSNNRVDQSTVYRMVRRRAEAADIRTDISPHTGRTTGITAFLAAGGKLEQAQDIAGHADPRTTRLYDHRRRGVERAEIERVQY